MSRGYYDLKRSEEDFFPLGDAEWGTARRVMAVAKACGWADPEGSRTFAFREGIVSSAQATALADALAGAIDPKSGKPRDSRAGAALGEVTGHEPAEYVRGLVGFLRRGEFEFCEW